MSDVLNIRLSIAGKFYNLSIPPQEEEAYRLAAKRINDMVSEYRQLYRDGYGTQDHLAMVSLNIMTNSILESRSREVGDEEMRSLAALAEALKTHLAK